MNLIALSLCLLEASFPSLSASASFFTTPEDVPTVLQSYGAAWKEAGFPVAWDEGVVSAFLTREGVQRSVIARRQGKVTWVFTVERSLWKPAPLPHAPSADGAGSPTQPFDGARTAFMAGSRAQVREQLRRRLAAEGYKTRAEEGDVLVHSRGAEVIRTQLWAVTAELTAVLQILMQEDGP